MRKASLSWSHSAQAGGAEQDQSQTLHWNEALLNNRRTCPLSRSQSGFTTTGNTKDDGILNVNLLINMIKKNKETKWTENRVHSSVWNGVFITLCRCNEFFWVPVESLPVVPGPVDQMVEPELRSFRSRQKSPELHRFPVALFLSVRSLQLSQLMSLDW